MDHLSSLFSITAEEKEAVEALERAFERGETYRRAAERAGVCMSCLFGAPETYGCPDCMNTGWDRGDPYARIEELRAEVNRLRAEVDRLSSQMSAVSA